MKHARAALFVAIVLALLPAHILAAAEEDGGGFGLGTSASYSIVMATHGMRSTLPVAPELYVRFLDLLEAGAFVTYGSGESIRFESYWSIVAGAELRLAPAARFYMPYAGLGISYAYHDYEVVIPDDHMAAPYVSIAPLRFSLKELFRYQAEIHPTVSVLQIRYGPLFADGGLPSWFDQGNFILMLDLVRVGVYFGL